MLDLVEEILPPVHAQAYRLLFSKRLDAYAHELAEKVRKHADDPRVKPHLLEGEWTGLRMGANVIDPEALNSDVQPS